MGDEISISSSSMKFHAHSCGISLEECSNNIQQKYKFVLQVKTKHQHQTNIITARLPHQHWFTTSLKPIRLKILATANVTINLHALVMLYLFWISKDSLVKGEKQK